MFSSLIDFAWSECLKLAYLPVPSSGLFFSTALYLISNVYHNFNYEVYFFAYLCINSLCHWSLSSPRLLHQISSTCDSGQQSRASKCIFSVNGCVKRREILPKSIILQRIFSSSPYWRHCYLLVRRDKSLVSCVASEAVASPCLVALLWANRGLCRLNSRTAASLTDPDSVHFQDL